MFLCADSGLRAIGMTGKNQGIDGIPQFAVVRPEADVILFIH